jgi:DNA polymerase-3 subunit epsilon
MSWLRARRGPDLRLPFAQQRVVVVDVETSGLDPRSDRLLSIGAVAVSGGLIRFDDSFHAVLRQAAPSDRRNILVHRIGGSAQLGGVEPGTALADFLSYAGAAPLVAFNAGFDRAVIERAAAAALGRTPGGAWLDLAILLPMLVPGRGAAERTLDDWAGMFGVENYARHDAVADALATAQLLLVALARAGKEGLRSCADLLRLQQERRWLGS